MLTKITSLALWLSAAAFTAPAMADWENDPGYPQGPNQGLGAAAHRVRTEAETLMVTMSYENRDTATAMNVGRLAKEANDLVCVADPYQGDGQCEGATRDVFRELADVLRQWDVLRSVWSQRAPHGSRSEYQFNQLREAVRYLRYSQGGGGYPDGGYPDDVQIDVRPTEPRQPIPRPR